MNRPLLPRLAVCCLLTLQLALLPHLSQQIDQLDDQKQQQQNFHEESTPRSLQSNSNSNSNSNYNYNYQTCPNNNNNNDNNENENINQVLAYLDDHKPSIENQILQSYASARGNATKPSLQYLYADFRSALEWMATVGVDKQSTKNNNNNNDNNNDNAFKFYMGPNNCNKDGWHIGLANIATFLSQSMTTVILNDTCDELNWEMVQPPNGVDVSGKLGVYPISNACGQLGYQYDDSPLHTCSGDAQDAKFACPIDPTMEITATYKSSLRRTPPELQCFPRTDDMPYTGFYNPNGNSNVVVNGLGVVPNRAGRTDVEGCCWWGRGALHTKGTCNLGKLNYYLGGSTAATTDGRTNNRYADIDFCKNPEAICSDSRTMELRWIVALFEWVERIQSYNDDNGWNYMEQLHAVMEGDLLNDLKFEQNHFIDAVGGIVHQGCPSPPCDKDNLQRVHLARERKANFKVALEALELPVRGAIFREMELHLNTVKQDFEDVILLSKTPNPKKGGKTMHQSYRYHFADFIESLRLMSDIGFEGNQFYIGQSSSDGGGGGMDMNAGMFNIAMFLTQAVVMSIQDDACDEHNTQMVNGRYPVSNACGQYGTSYQSIECIAENVDMECPLDLNQSFSAVTRALYDRAPQPFKCAPKSQFPITGYWDDKRIEENHKYAFANQNGRTDVEGCCWWGRGVLRQVTQGRCFFGKLNYYIGKRAATDGRPSLYPNVDFCKFPEAVCASEFSNELRWVSGMFHWIMEVQSYDQDGWKYIEKMTEISVDISQGSTLDSSFMMAVDCITKTGSVDCDQAEDNSETLSAILSAIANFKLPTMSPTTTAKPSITPTDHPTVSPSSSPSAAPTSSFAPTGSPIIFEYPSREFVETIIKEMKDYQLEIERDIIAPKNTDEISLYSFEGFVETLKIMSEGTVKNKYFYIGHGKPTNRVIKKRGLVNIALFLAHTKTVAIRENTCDEQNVDEIEKRLPLSNSCGQHGESYQDMRCPAGESFMECAPDPNMQMSAVDKGQYSEGTTPPFFCGPSWYFPSTGYFDVISSTIMNDNPLANRAGRTDVSACCWWGRGSAQAKGVCMYGKLNYYIGARAAAEGRRSLYPDIDFCSNPSSICSGPYALTLMWITGMFVWIEQVQENELYSEMLDMFVSGGMSPEDRLLIDVVSDILDGGRNKDERYENFQSALEAVGLTSS